MATEVETQLPDLASLRKLRVDQVARWLEIHPYEVIRALVQQEALPADLRLETQHVEQVRELLGLQTWWNGGEAPARDGDLIAALILRLTTRLAIIGDPPDSAPPRPLSTRSDNLFRGLDPEQQMFLRRAVNHLVKMGYLDIVMTAAGLSVTLRPESRRELRLLVPGSVGIQALVARTRSEHDDGG
ncbi:MAG: hypothetical protein EXR69_16725 [Myxococcales bacterium]|nr:hypothetical protein [Myxococcales bacterium]